MPAGNSRSSPPSSCCGRRPRPTTSSSETPELSTARAVPGSAATSAFAAMQIAAIAQTNRRTGDPNHRCGRPGRRSRLHRHSRACVWRRGAAAGGPSHRRGSHRGQLRAPGRDDAHHRARRFFAGAAPARARAASRRRASRPTSGTFIGHGSIRDAVFGSVNRAPTRRRARAHAHAGARGHARRRLRLEHGTLLRARDVQQDR